MPDLSSDCCWWLGEFQCCVSESVIPDLQAPETVLAERNIEQAGRQVWH
jgi:hypothetical protein